MKSLLIIVMTVFISSISISQTDSAALLREAEMKLQNHSAQVSAVLSDRAYAKLHAQASFRELIKKYSSTDVLIITDHNEPGKKIKVVATITNKDGQPIPDALVYLYQTDSRGWYAADAPHVLMNEGDFRHARLFGYVKTDKNGKFELHTVKPSGYPQSDLPAHIHVHVSVEGYRPYVAEFLFQDDERLKGEVLNRAVVGGGMIAIPQKAEAPFEQKFSYELKLVKK